MSTNFKVKHEKSVMSFKATPLFTIFKTCLKLKMAEKYKCRYLSKVFVKKNWAKLAIDIF